MRPIGANETHQDEPQRRGLRACEVMSTSVSGVTSKSVSGVKSHSHARTLEARELLKQPWGQLQGH